MQFDSDFCARFCICMRDVLWHLKFIFLLICIKLFNNFTINISITIFILIFSIFTLFLYVSFVCLDSIIIAVGFF